MYAQTEDKSDEEKDDFYGRLGEVVRFVKRHDMLLLVGDFNAKVGQEDGIWRDVIGVFGVGARNNNGLYKATRILRGIPPMCDKYSLQPYS